MTRRIDSRSPDDTIMAGFGFAKELVRGDCVALRGTLGSGKTQFVKGLCRYFGVREGVTSPTFVLVHRYEGKDDRDMTVLVHHFDFYRVRSEEELYDLGIEELVGGNDLSVVEWADRFPAVLPARRYDVHCEHGDYPDQRRITITRPGGTNP